MQPSPKPCCFGNEDLVGNLQKKKLVRMKMKMMMAFPRLVSYIQIVPVGGVILPWLN